MNLSKQTINTLPFPNQAYFFALCSKHAYLKPKEAKPLFKSMGFSADYFDNRGSQAYFLYNKTDAVIACRGTEPTEFKDIKADLEFDQGPTPYGTELVHDGFKKSVRNIWGDVYASVNKHTGKTLWCTGHSLGAAMSTLISFYLAADNTLPNAFSLFTYGSPKVGSKDFVKRMDQLRVPHYRFVNNCDIVPRVPPGNYEHHSGMYYMNHWGNLRAASGWQLTKDRLRGFVKGATKGEINYFTNHSIERYCTNLERWTRGEERPETLF